MVNDCNLCAQTKCGCSVRGMFRFRSLICIVCSANSHKSRKGKFAAMRSSHKSSKSDANEVVLYCACSTKGMLILFLLVSRDFIN